MRNDPTIQMAKPDPGTAIVCPCGAELAKLAPGEGVYPSGVLMRTLGKTENKFMRCPECRAEATIPVTTQK